MGLRPIWYGSWSSENDENQNPNVLGNPKYEIPNPKYPSPFRLKFRRVQQTPQDVLEGVVAVVDFPDVIAADLGLPGRRFAGVNNQVQLAQRVVIALLFLDNL